MVALIGSASQDNEVKVDDVDYADYVEVDDVAICLVWPPVPRKNVFKTKGIQRIVKTNNQVVVFVHSDSIQFCCC